MFSGEFWEIFNKTFFREHIRVTAFDSIKIILKKDEIITYNKE